MNLSFIFGLGATLTFILVSYQDWKMRKVSRWAHILFALLSVLYSLSVSSLTPLVFSLMMLIIAAPFHPFKQADINIFLGFSGLEQSILGIALGLGIIIWSNLSQRKNPVSPLLLGLFVLTWLWRWLT